MLKYLIQLLIISNYLLGSQQKKIFINFQPSKQDQDYVEKINKNLFNQKNDNNNLFKILEKKTNNILFNEKNHNNNLFEILEKIISFKNLLVDIDKTKINYLSYRYFNKIEYPRYSLYEIKSYFLYSYDKKTSNTFINKWFFKNNNKIYNIFDIYFFLKDNKHYQDSITINFNNNCKDSEECKKFFNDFINWKIQEIEKAYYLLKNIFYNNLTEKEKKEIKIINEVLTIHKNFPINIENNNFNNNFIKQQYQLKTNDLYSNPTILQKIFDDIDILNQNKLQKRQIKILDNIKKDNEIHLINQSKEKDNEIHLINQSKEKNKKPFYNLPQESS